MANTVAGAPIFPTCENAMSFMRFSRNVFRVGQLAMMACTLCASAQQRATPGEGGGYTRTVWRVADGLPEDTVQALAEDSGGELWIGTTGGASTFDGAHVRAVHAETTPAVGVNSVFCLLAEKSGVVWAGTEGDGLLRLDRSGAKLFSAADGLTDGFVRKVFRDTQQRLWIGTDDGLFLADGARFQRVDGTPKMPRMAVHAIAEDALHRIWVGGSSLIAISPDQSVTSFPLPGAYSESRVKSILETSDHTVWVGTVGGIARLEGDGFHSVPGLNGTVRTMLQTRDGTLWIGTIGHGLWTFRAGSLSHFTPSGLLPSDTILSLLQDDSEQLWIGTQNGMVRLSSTPVHMIPLPGAGDSDFETLAGDLHGTLRVAAQRLYRIDGSRATPDSLAGLGGVSVRNVFTSRGGDLWVGTDGSGAYRIAASGAMTHYSAPAQLTNNFVRAFLEARNGDVWIATDEGVSSIGAQGVRRLTLATGLVYFSTRCLIEDHEGTIWIGTDRGLSAWRNGAFEHNAATQALAHEKIWSILEDSAGVLWFGTRDHGLFQSRAGRIAQITTEQGLPTNSIYQLLEDHRGLIWMTGPNTIASVSREQMDGALPTTDAPASVTTYAMPFGAEDAQLYGGREPAGYVAPDDSVWFPTTRGVAHVVETGGEQPGLPPRVVLRGLEEDGRPVWPGDGISVAAGVTRLNFEFAAIDLRSRTDLRFRYRLEGLDHDWIAAGPSETATYTNLKPGHYRFRVQAFEASQPGQIAEASIRFGKRRTFYQTWWFYVLCVLLAVGIAWSIYRLRLRQIRTRFAAVLEERGRLAREIHDTVLQGCTGLSAVLEAMAIESEGNGTQRTELLEYARVQTRAVLDEARRSVWNMRSEREERVDLIQALGMLAEQTMREHRGVRIELIAPDPASLRSSMHHEAIMVVREAVWNAVRHGNAERIEIIVAATAGSLTIGVQDFGVGIPAEQIEAPLPGHFGIIGMRERMKRLGGALQIESRPGTGTLVRLRIPLKREHRAREVHSS
jgi:ligand-binding sensor domain-containing protein/signal transduction histidine kinase